MMHTFNGIYSFINYLLLNMVFTWDDAHRLNPHKEKLFSLLVFFLANYKVGVTKLIGRFKSKRPRADDADYNPTTDSEAQSSAGGSISMDTEDVPHAHPDYPIDITGWTYPKKRFSMAEYCSRRTVNQYDLPSDTNIQFFHTQLQFDVFWGTLMDTNFHKHQVIDWTFMLGQSVMEGLIPKFEACGLYHFMG
jgi:hypothetical protein